MTQVSNTIEAKMKKEQLFKAAGIIAAASIMSKILGFFRETSMAAVFGASHITDAYLVALIIPSMLFSIVGSALTTTLIPVYTQRLHEEGEQAGWQFINSLLNFVLIACLAITGIGLLAAPMIVRVVAPGFQGGTYALTVSLTRVLLLTMIFQGAIAVFVGLLQAKQRFTLPALIGIPYNIILITAIVWGGRHFGITAVAAGMVLATLSELLVMLPGLKGIRFSYRWLLSLRDSGMMTVGKMLLPIILATGAGQMGLIVDRMLASGLQEGSIAALNFGYLLSQFPLGIFAVAVSTVIYPTFSQYAATKDLAGLRRALVGGVRVTLFVVVPMSVALIVLRAPIVRVLFQRGAFDPRATGLTASALLFFSLGLAPMALRDLISRVYFSMQDTLTPMLLGIGAVALNIGLNFLLIGPLAHGGLALSTSLAALFAMVTLFVFLRRRIGGLGGKEMLDGFWRICVASGAMGLMVTIAWAPLASLCQGRGFIWNAGCLAVTILIGAISYGIASFILRLPELGFFIDFGRRTARRLLADG
jgi:putative peptidoglycan lipid II flippase